MKLPRDLSGKHLIKSADHDPLKIGTLSAIIGEMAIHFNISKEEILKQLFDK